MTIIRRVKIEIEDEAGDRSSSESETSLRMLTNQVQTLLWRSGVRVWVNDQRVEVFDEERIEDIWKNQ